MKHFVLILLCVVLFASNAFASAALVPAFSKWSSAGMSVDAGKQGTNTMQVVGATFSKPGGAPTLTINPPMFPIISPEAFGAKGDGATDDTNAFAAALKSIQVTGGTLQLAAKTYKVGLNANWNTGASSGWLNSSGRTFSVSFIIRGMGPGTVIKAVSGTGYTMLFDTPQGGSVSNADYNKRWITVEDLAIDANGEPYGLQVISGPGLRVKNCSIYNNTATGASSANYATSGGLYISGSGLFRFENIAFSPNASATAINVNNSAGDGSIKGCDIAAGYVGIYMKDATGDNIVFNNHIYNQVGYGLITNGSVFSNNQLEIFSNQFAQAGVSMISLAETGIGSAAINIHDNKIWIDKNQGNGITLGTVYDFSIHDNNFPWINGGVGNGKYAINATSSSSIGSINNNIIKLAEIGGTGINLAGSNINVYGNVMEGMANDATSSFVTESGNNNTIKHNISYGGLSLPYAIKLVGTPSGLRVFDNKFFSGRITNIVDKMVIQSGDTTGGGVVYQKVLQVDPATNRLSFVSNDGSTILGQIDETGNYLAKSTFYPSNQSTAGFSAGNGSPNGVVTSNPGSLYLNLSGGAATTLYIKESGTGNSGWVGK